MRLQRFLALAGIASRRASETLISSGRIKVNGKLVTRPGAVIDPEQDIIEVDDRRVTIEPKLYVLLNKPAGYLTTVSDERGRPTVADLVADLPARVYPVGRLDLDTEGVLLMTNDGDLAFRLAHPRFGVDKKYHAVVAGKPGPADIEALRGGVDIGGIVTSAARVRMVKPGSRESTLEIVIHEGRKRQIKRMCKAVGHPVIRLQRVEYGGIGPGSLKPGRYRMLTKKEVEHLQEKVGLR